jgi:hypothetical protein
MVLAVGFLLLIFLGGFVFVWESVGLVRDVAAMLFTRTADVESVRDGRVEVQGAVEPADQTLDDPFSGADAVAYNFEVRQEERTIDNLFDVVWPDYHRLYRGQRSVPFYVDDGTGRVLVDPGAPDGEDKTVDGTVNLYATTDTEVHLDDGATPPEPVLTFHQHEDFDVDTASGRRYESARVEPGDDVYVLGTAAFRDGERVIDGDDDRFVIANASEPRAIAYNAGWAATKFVGGTVLSLGSGWLLLAFAGVF